MRRMCMGSVNNHVIGVQMHYMRSAVYGVRVIQYYAGYSHYGSIFAHWKSQTGSDTDEQIRKASRISTNHLEKTHFQTNYNSWNIVKLHILSVCSSALENIITCTWIVNGRREQKTKSRLHMHLSHSLQFLIYQHISSQATCTDQREEANVVMFPDRKKP